MLSVVFMALAGCAPPVVLQATHASVLEFLDRDLLESFAVESDERTG